MGITPNEMRNQEFSKAMRGFAPAEVESFKEAAASALEEARMELLKMTEERDTFKNRFEELKGLEDALKNVMVDARKNAESIVENARKEADLIIREAHQRRDDAIEEKHRELADLDAKVHEIEFTRRSFYSRLKAEIEAHLKLMEQVYIPRRAEDPPTGSPTRPAPVMPAEPDKPNEPEENVSAEEAPAEVPNEEAPIEPGESPEENRETEQESETANVYDNNGEDDIDRIVDQFRNEDNRGDQ